MNPFANIALVFILVGLFWLMAKTVVIVWDALADAFAHPMHPIKMALRGVVAALGVGLIVGLICLFRVILVALAGGATN